MRSACRRCWGAAGLTASAGVAGWVEMLLLRRTLNGRIGRTGLPVIFTAKLWRRPRCGAAVAWAIKTAAARDAPGADRDRRARAVWLVFFAAAFALRVPEVATVAARFARLARR